MTDIKKNPVEVVSWTPHANWIFKATSNECQICREDLVSPCMNCSSTHTKGEMLCYVSKGNCGHCFHKHCIDGWLKNATNCPICSIPLNISVKNMNGEDEWKKLLKKQNHLTK